MKIFRVINKVYFIIKAIVGLLGLISGFCILAIITIISYEIFCRYVLNKPSSWVFDVSSYLLLAVAVFSGVYALEHDRHVNFPFLVEKVKPKSRLIIILIGSILGIIYFFILLIESIKVGLIAIQRNTYTFAQTRIPEIYLYLIIMLGAFLLLLTFLLKSITTHKKD